MYREITAKLMEKYNISCRKANKMCEIKSTGFVTNVIKGRKDFTKEVLKKFIRKSPLNKTESLNLMKIFEKYAEKNKLRKGISKLNTKIKNLYLKQIDLKEKISEKKALIERIEEDEKKLFLKIMKKL